MYIYLSFIHLKPADRLRITVYLKKPFFAAAYIRLSHCYRQAAIHGNLLV